MYLNKYLKYKNKYLQLQSGGELDYFLKSVISSLSEMKEQIDITIKEDERKKIEYEKEKRNKSTYTINGDTIHKHAKHIKETVGNIIRIVGERREALKELAIKTEENIVKIVELLHKLENENENERLDSEMKSYRRYEIFACMNIMINLQLRVQLPPSLTDDNGMHIVDPRVPSDSYRDDMPIDDVKMIENINAILALMQYIKKTINDVLEKLELIKNSDKSKMKTMSYDPLAMKCIRDKIQMLNMLVPIHLDKLKSDQTYLIAENFTEFNTFSVPEEMLFQYDYVYLSDYDDIDVEENLNRYVFNIKDESTIRDLLIQKSLIEDLSLNSLVYLPDTLVPFSLIYEYFLTLKKFINENEIPERKKIESVWTPFQPNCKKIRWYENIEIS